MLLQMIGLGVVTLWGAMVLLGLLGKRWEAAVAAALTAVLAIIPFLPRVVFYVLDSDAFIIKYGSAATDEVIIGGVCVALGLVALMVTPLAPRRSWGWTLPALFSLPPVMFVFWLSFFFRLTF